MKNLLLIPLISSIAFLSACELRSHETKNLAPSPTPIALQSGSNIHSNNSGSNQETSQNLTQTKSGGIQDPRKIETPIEKIQPQNTIPKSENTTPSQKAPGEIEDDEMIDDSLTLISGHHEESCIDAYNAYNNRVKIPEGSESVIKHLDIGIIPKLNHCVLGYKSSTDVFTYFAIIDLDDNDSEIGKFECTADYDIEKDQIIPCSDEKLNAVYKEYEQSMSDFILTKE